MRSGGPCLQVGVQAHFEGDISTWGRRDDGSSEGEGSLSSGISPREAAQRRPWDQSAGMLVRSTAALGPPVPQ